MKTAPPSTTAAQSVLLGHSIILFHFMLVIFSELLQTEQFTKCIIGVLLLLVSAGIILADRKFFFNKPEGAAGS